MRRLPAAIWIVAPLVVALLYAGAYALLAPKPTLEDVVPKAAVITARFRGLAALDELWFYPSPGEGRPSEFLSAQRNLPGLAGVAPSGPVHFVFLPLHGRPDPSLLILPVADAQALRRRYEGRDLPEAAARGLERNPHQLEIRGDFAALAWDREIVRHLGEGGITLEDRGEDLGVALHVPGALGLALALGGQAPWKSLLEALGARPGETSIQADAASGLRRPVYPAGRTPRVGAAWHTARMWAYRARGEVEVELVPADPGLRALLAAVVAEPPVAVFGRESALGVLEIPSRAARRALQGVLEAAGCALPPPGEDAPRGGEAPGLAVSARINREQTHAWTLSFEPFGGDLPALDTLLGALPSANGRRGYAPGEFPWTVFDPRGGLLAPAGLVVGPQPPDTRLHVGADAEELSRATAGIAPPALPLGLPLAAGEAVIARFRLEARAATALLGGALTRGGLLAVLGGGDLEGLLATDGERLKARIVRSKR